MNIENKKPKIYLICGRARHGKDTIAGFLKKFYEEDGKKVIYSRAGKYIKFYAMEMTDWDGSEESKPRKLLQELGTDVIRNKLNKAEMFIERQLDDIEIYSYFYDDICNQRCYFLFYFSYFPFNYYYHVWNHVGTLPNRCNPLFSC